MTLATASRLSIAILIVVGCATSKPPVTPPPSGLDQPGPGSGPAPGSLADRDRRPEELVKPDPVVRPPTCTLKPVFFGFNQSVLSDETRTALQHDAACLKELGFPSVIVNGHCDERGTSEYNLVLGLKRAERVREYLVGLGVPRASLTPNTLGKEAPVCTEGNEACWSRCRRADLVR
jgi:peptidoglycan-associated lipoprotein